jgi:hypothetical protein
MYTYILLLSMWKKKSENLKSMKYGDDRQTNHNHDRVKL